MRCNSCVITSYYNLIRTNNSLKKPYNFLSLSIINTTTINSNTACHFLHSLSCNNQNMFDETTKRDVITWTKLISSSTRDKSFSESFTMFVAMQREGVCPNKFTLSVILKCCSSVLFGFKPGKSVHGWVIRHGIVTDTMLENSILDLYMKCGALNCAKRWFELVAVKDTVTWNIMVNGYLRVGDVNRSIALFENMVVKDVATWNTIIDGVMKIGFERISLDLLYKMAEHGPSFNVVTFSIALNLASIVSDFLLGKQIHCRILRILADSDVYVKSSLLDMYCKCGQMSYASAAFSNMGIDIYGDGMGRIVLWSSLVSGYVRKGDYKSALGMFSSMIHEQMELDRFSLTSIVSVCANSGFLELGRQIHAHIVKIGYIFDVHLCSSFIDMYAKCGSLNDAQAIFELISSRPNAVTWTSMILGLALHGEAMEAIQLFERMLENGISPNEITFLGVLTACSHVGLIDEGSRYFKLMQSTYNIAPGVEHYTCMVDLYGRAGCFDEMDEFIRRYDIDHLSPVWNSVLSSCKIYKNGEMGKWVSEKLLELEPLDSSPYTMLSNLFALNHRFNNAAEVRCLMQHRQVNKPPGQSWIA